MASPSSADEFYATVGWAPGESPFRIRGNAYVFHRDYVRAKLPGGEEAQRAALGEVGKHEFFETLFLAQGWYDVFPLVALGYACAEVTGTTFRDFLKERALDQVEKDLRFIRRLLVKLASPAKVAARLPSIAASYFDFTEVDATEIEDGLATSVMRGVPKILVPWILHTNGVFISYAMSVNGAKDVAVDITRHESGGVVERLQVESLKFSIRWAAGK